MLKFEKKKQVESMAIGIFKNRTIILLINHSGYCYDFKMMTKESFGLLIQVRND
jgi:hypothetical protein